VADVLTDTDSLTRAHSVVSAIGGSGAMHDAHTAVLRIDVDRLTEINDSFGDDVGDAVLAEVEHRIRTTCRSHDVITHLGSDEFVVMLFHRDAISLERLAHSVLARISDPLPAHLGPTYVAASGGLAFNPEDTDDDPVERATRALGASKQAGRAQLVIG
jgi:diguanylate cyclase (GGDEF)-like protein